MKRIISGTTYNTKTAWNIFQEGNTYLYKTPHDKYFLFIYSEVDNLHEIRPLDEEEVFFWLSDIHDALPRRKKVHMEGIVKDYFSFEYRLAFQLSGSLLKSIEGESERNGKSINEYIIDTL